MSNISVEEILKSKQSYLKECLLDPRKDDICFHMNTNDDILTRLYKYAIVPLEKYNTLEKENEQFKSLIQSFTGTKNT